VQLNDVLDRIHRDHVTILNKGDRTANLGLWNNVPNAETMGPVKPGLIRSLHKESHPPAAESPIGQAGYIKSQSSAHDQTCWF
jgi:hypothetical protein